MPTCWKFHPRVSLLRFAVALNLASVAALAQDQTAPPPVERWAEFPVRGVVLNSLTRQPVARALVESNSEGSLRAALSNGEGRFELILREGQNMLTVRRPGWTGGEGHLIEAGPATPDLTLSLTPQADIVGHIALSTGEPAEGITFLAYRKSFAESHERWELGASARTDSEGTLRLLNLSAPGLWVLCSNPLLERAPWRPAIPSEQPTALVGYPPVCYPGPIPALYPGGGSGESTAANVLALMPGRHGEIELTLSRQPFYRVAIAIPNGEAEPNLTVQVHDPTGRVLDFSESWNAKKALVETFLPNGSYFLDAHSMGPAPSYGRIDFQVANAPLVGLSMALLPLRPIPVEIHKEFSASEITGNQTNLSASGRDRRNPDNPAVNLALIPADASSNDSGGVSLSPQTGSESGSLFQMENVIPGRYWVQTYPYEGYVSSISSGGVDLASQPLAVGPGGASQPIQINLRNDTGQIQCTVHTASLSATASGQIAQAYVYALPAAPGTSQIPFSQGQGQEPITLANLPPGDYRVVAYDKFQLIDLADPAQLEQIAARGRSVTVTPGSVASIQVELMHTETDSPEKSSNGNQQ